MSARKKALTEATAAEIAAPVVLINIDKGKQRMTVFVDGVEHYDWPVSTGLRGYSTPSGTQRPEAGCFSSSVSLADAKACNTVCPVAAYSIASIRSIQGRRYGPDPHCRWTALDRHHTH